jgi:glycosyltransferase involved in cell wall biosynthesis
VAAEVRRLGLNDRVTLLGYRRQPWPYYEQARCFVIPSTKEPFGLVLVEALAHGLPVVATACHGPREIVTEGLGHLVEIGDEAELAAAMTKALAEPGDPADRKAHAARFSLEAALDAYAELFEKVARQPAAQDRSNAVTMARS